MIEEPLVADRIALAVGMLTTIDLDNEPLLSAYKVYDIGSDWFLTYEFEPADRSRTKVAPKFSFGERRIFAQLSRRTCLRYVRTTHAS